MIHLTRLNRVPLVVNSDLIEHIDATPDTVIVMTTGQRFMVLEAPEEIIDRVVRFRRLILDGIPFRGMLPASQAVESTGTTLRS